MCLGVCSHESRSACTLDNLEPKRKVIRAKRTSEFIVYGQASVVSRPPPTVWSGRGGGRAGGCKKRGRGRCRWTVGWCWGRPGVTRKPYASHKPYNARAPAFIDLNRYFAPYTPNPKPRLNLNAGSKPKAEHKPSTLTNLHPKSSLSPCRLEAL